MARTYVVKRSDALRMITQSQLGELGQHWLLTRIVGPSGLRDPNHRY